MCLLAYSQQCQAWMSQSSGLPTRNRKSIDIEQGTKDSHACLNLVLLMQAWGLSGICRTVLHAMCVEKSPLHKGEP